MQLENFYTKQKKKVSACRQGANFGVKAVLAFYCTAQFLNCSGLFQLSGKKEYIYIYVYRFPPFTLFTLHWQLLLFTKITFLPFLFLSAAEDAFRHKCEKTHPKGPNKAGRLFKMP